MNSNEKDSNLEERIVSTEITEADIISQVPTWFYIDIIEDIRKYFNSITNPILYKLNRIYREYAAISYDDDSNSNEKKRNAIYIKLREIIPESRIILLAHYYRYHTEFNQETFFAFEQINKHSISSYERDKSEPPDELKIAIANHFGVSIDYLLGLTDNPKPYRKSNNVILLPADMPEDMVQNVREYASYIMHKYKKSKKHDQ